MVEAASDGIIVGDRKARILSANGAARGRGEWTRLEDDVPQRASARFSHTHGAGCLAEVRRASGLP